MAFRTKIHLIAPVPLALAGSIWGSLAYAGAHQRMDCYVLTGPGSSQGVPPGTHMPGEIYRPHHDD